MVTEPGDWCHGSGTALCTGCQSCTVHMQTDHHTCHPPASIWKWSVCQLLSSVSGMQAEQCPVFHPVHFLSFLLQETAAATTEATRCLWCMDKPKLECAWNNTGRTDNIKCDFFTSILLYRENVTWTLPFTASHVHFQYSFVYYAHQAAVMATIRWLTPNWANGPSKSEIWATLHLSLLARVSGVL